MNNDHLVLLCGKSATGKSASLMNLENPQGVIYLNCEAGKKLPFRGCDFKQLVITDPLQVPQAFTEAEGMPDVHTIVVDSQTYLMDMYESMYVNTATNTMQAWSHYAQFFRNLMQNQVAKSTKNIIFIAHVSDQLNESEHVIETSVPIKGSLKKNGVESFFSCIIASKKVNLKTLEPYQSELLNISEEEEMLGFKYVFQTKLTKESVNERLRGPLALWDNKETFIDNNMQLVINRLHEYYQ